MVPRLTPETLLVAMRKQTRAARQTWVSAVDLEQTTSASPAAIRRALKKLVEEGRIRVQGAARATRYALPVNGVAAGEARAEVPAPTSVLQAGSLIWSPTSEAVRTALTTPLASRRPVGYQRSFVDDYEPNVSSLMPASLAAELAQVGGLSGQFPAGTYARKVLEQLLIDLSWSSSHLEGNRYNLLDTEALFKSGAAPHDPDQVMLLNHKAAIEFIVSALPEQGMTSSLVRNTHAVLMQDLLADADALGAIRQRVVNISGTVYTPMQVPGVLEEMFEHIVHRAQHIKNAVESAFFLWVNLAYLQPFEDGNKRVSRLAANMPLMLYNLAPLSFLDVDRTDYALAMMGVYERCDVSMAVDLFEWTYRRSLTKYQVVQASMGAPDRFRIEHRQHLTEAVGAVVRDGKTAEQAIEALGLTPDDGERLGEHLSRDLSLLSDHNYARYQLRASELKAWIEAGRHW